MAHQRKVIRHYLVARLLGETAAEGRVIATQTTPVRKVDLPFISVYTTEEDVDEERSNTAPREYTRDLTAKIAGWVVGGDGVDDRMDDLAEQIEQVIAADRYLGDNAAETTLAGTTLEFTDKGDELMGMVTLTYSVRYQSAGYVEPVEPDEFETAGVEYPLAGSTPTTEVPTDLVDVRTP